MYGTLSLNAGLPEVPPLESNSPKRRPRELLLTFGPIGLNAKVTLRVLSTGHCSGLAAFVVKYVHHVTDEPLSGAPVMALVAAVSDDAVEAYHAEHVGRLVLVRKPFVQWSSTMISLVGAVTVNVATELVAEPAVLATTTE
jgi:hypothetical protein